MDPSNIICSQQKIIYQTRWRLIVSDQVDSKLIENQYFQFGKNIENYLNKHFYKISSNQDRKLSYLEKLVFNMILLLRNQNLRNNYKSDKILKDSLSKEPYNRLEKATGLKFDYLSAIPFQGFYLSTILKVQNQYSRERAYLIDADEYYSCPSLWNNVIDQIGDGYKSIIMLYDPKQQKTQIKHACLFPQNFSQFSLQFIEQHQTQFKIPLYQKSHFKNENLYTKNQIWKTNIDLTPFQRAKLGKQMETEFKYLFLTKRSIPKRLSKYVDSIAIVVNDMIKFVGFNEEIVFESNYETEQVQLCIRNSQRVAYQDIKTGQFIDYLNYQSNRYIYLTKIRCENVIFFLNYCDLYMIKVVQTQYEDQIRLKMLNLSFCDQLNPSINLNQFKNCLIHYVGRKDLGFIIRPQTIQQFIITYKQNPNSDQYKYLNYHHRLQKIRNKNNYPYRFSIALPQKRWSIIQYTQQTNLQQLKIVSEIMKRQIVNNIDSFQDKMEVLKCFKYELPTI